MLIIDCLNAFVQLLILISFYDDWQQFFKNKTTSGWLRLVNSSLFVGSGGRGIWITWVLRMNPLALNLCNIDNILNEYCNLFF